MRYSDISNILPFCMLRTLSDADKSVQILGVTLLNGNETKYDRDLLYCGNAALLQEKLLEDAAPLSFLLFTEAELPTCTDEMKPHNISVICGGGVNAPEAAAALSAKLREELHIFQNKQLLSDAFFSGKGLQYVVDTAFEILGNPVFIIDESHQIQACKYGELPTEQNYFWHFCVRDRELNENDISSMRYMQRMNLSDRLASAKGPIQYYNELVEMEEILVPIRVDGVLVSRVTVLARFKPFEDEDTEYIKQLATFVEQEMKKVYPSTNQRGRQLAFFLESLLSQKDMNSLYIRRIMAMNNLASNGNFAIAVITGRGDENMARSLQMIVERLKPTLTGHLYTVRQNEIVILFVLGKNNILSAHIAGELNEVVKVNDYFVGISNVFSDINESSNYYIQASKALDTGLTYNEGHLLFFHNIAAMEFLITCRENINLGDYCDPALLRLYERDQRENTTLFYTLYVYLENCLDKQKSAEELHIHKNTMLYRLNRIKEFLGNDLNEGEYIFMLMLSFRIMRTLRLFAIKIVDGKRVFYKPEGIYGGGSPQYI